MKNIKISHDYIRSIISEEKALLHEHARYNQVLLREAERMRADGYDQYMINEGLLQLIKDLGGGFVDTFKYQIAMFLLKKLGLNPEKSLAQLIANIIERADILEFKKYFGPDACRYLPEIIVDAMAEQAVLEPFLDAIIIDGLGVEKGTLVTSFREALTNKIMDTEFLTDLKTKLSDVICDISISDIVGKFKNLIPGLGDAEQGDVVDDDQLDLPFPERAATA